MVILLPRLPGPAADNLIEHFLADGPANWTGFDPDALPEAVRFAATGGSPANRRDLVKLRETVVQRARANGFGARGSATSHARFDAELGASFAEMPLLSSGEALRDDFWTFIGVTLAPDVVHWRFASSRARYLGGVRNTFQRLWLRARALDRGDQHPRRWQLLEELTEDALVQITERPSIGADPVLARAIAEGWLRASTHHGKSAMEPIMRRAVLRARIWNEIRSLADLPAEALESVLDEAFDLPARGRHDGTSAAAGIPQTVHGSHTLAGSGVGDAPSPPARVSRDTPKDLVRLRAQAARRILTEAKKRRWVSGKSKAALAALQEETCDLGLSERNALEYLLGRMRAVPAMREDVALLMDLFSEEAEAATGVRPDRERTAALVRDQIGIDSASTAVRAQPPGETRNEPAPDEPQPASDGTEPPLTKKQTLYLDFWEAFQSLVAANSDKFKPRRPQPTHYTGYPIGRPGFKLGAAASLGKSKRWPDKRNQLRVELVVEGRDSHRHFDALKKRREGIERELAFRLIWSRKKRSVKRRRIYIRRTVNLHDRGAWPEYHRWLLYHLLALDRVFRPRIEGL